ncbi:DNA/RNA non-specific endonuclease [Psychrobacter phenylpyruvicus]|uniref:DNA/RNA non-specific endonuclease n=1 Tax=Psychrobacter phenylpyruvicus TaxID=29432 RepID=UPI0035713B8F
MSNGHKYITNSKGRINKFKVELSLNKIDRNTNRQRNAGKAENAAGDDGSHFIASILNGRFIEGW